MTTDEQPSLFDLDEITSLPHPAGQQEPRNGQPSPRLGVAGDSLWAFDWAIGREVAGCGPSRRTVPLRDAAGTHPLCPARGDGGR